jgi:hypothetical protein
MNTRRLSHRCKRYSLSSGCILRIPCIRRNYPFFRKRIRSMSCRIRSPSSFFGMSTFGHRLVQNMEHAIFYAQRGWSVNHLSLG